MLPNIRATLERKFVANNFKKTPNLVTLFSTPWYTKASFVTIIVIGCCHLGGSFLDPLLTCGSRFDNTIQQSMVRVLIGLLFRRH